MLVGLVSAKGAPGVTTAAVALTAVSGGVMVELDPSGGSIDCWLTATGEPGLIPAASALRRQAEPTALLSFATEIAPSVRSIRAPTSGALAESTIAALNDRLLGTLALLDETVIIDAGRWARSQTTARRLAGCDVVALVCSPTIEGVESARWQLDHIESRAERVELVLVGDRPYGPDEVAKAVGTSVAGVLAWDPRGLARLLNGDAGSGWSRSALARSARSVIGALVPATAPRTVPLSDDSSKPPEAASVTEPGVAHA